VTLCASGDSSTSAELRACFPKSLRPAGLTGEALQYALMHVVMSLKDAGDFDIIHNHNGPPSELGMALSHLTRVPMLTTLHNNLTKETEFIWSNYRGWYNTISRAQYRAAPCLPRASYAGVVHNSIDIDSYPFSATKSDFALFMGRFAPEKAPHLAIEAALRAGVRILLAGKIAAPEEREYFDAAIAPRIDGKRVEFLGEAGGELKRQLFRDARCLLAPIQWEEPFGLVMIEAMACGTPAIAFSRGAAPELIEDGCTGFLVHNVEEMARAVEQSGTIDPLTCRRHVESCFGPAALADNYLRVYERIIEAEGERRDRCE
jgi:glycosyltransferase involved in cell wall biosynthesis